MKRLPALLPPWSLTTVISLLILYLTLVPQPMPDGFTEPFPGADKVVHGIMFAALTGAIVFDRGRSARRVPTQKFTLLAAGIAIAAGALIELFQLWMAMGRGCEIADLAADTLGALFAAPISRFIYSKF
ncbi:MAG: VanZ family protein [Muribaculaceae bacterium]|nr:VanZ family protein [Muribaculaceae bacterium]